MAVDYKVVEKDGKFHVEERLTEYTIKSFNTREEAKKYMKFLNLGGAFAGFTPSFILNKSSKNMQDAQRQRHEPNKERATEQSGENGGVPPDHIFCQK